MNPHLAPAHPPRVIPRGLIGVLTATIASLSPFTASAGFMLEPVSASTSSSTWGGSPMAVVDQSGMWTNYTSGVTDFASFMAGDPVHANGGGWASNFFDLTGNLDFDLGGTYRVSGLAVWSLQRDNAIQAFRLLASDDASFANATDLGTFTNVLAGAQGFNFNRAQTFSFAETSAAFVRMEVLSNYGDIFNTTLLEVAFDASPAAVPEPASSLMLGVGAAALGLGARARRRASSGRNGRGGKPSASSGH